MKALRRSFVWIVCVLNFTWTHAAERLPVPDDSAQKSATITVKEIFRQDLAGAKTPGQQTQLAQRMLSSLEERPEAATANYVLLMQAQALAVKALDVEFARKAIDELSARYEVDALSLRAAAIRDMAKGPTDTKLHGNLAQAALTLVDDCVEQERFDVAVTAVDLAYSLSVRSKSNDLRRQATARKGELADLQKLWDASRKAEETLKASPQDPIANDAVGRFLIAAKSDWDRGLSHLSRSSDKELQKVATKDNETIDAPGLPSREATVSLADEWWDLAAKQSSPPLKAAMKLRAGQWYDSVFGGLEGLTKAKVDQRITDSRWQKDPVLERRMPRSRSWRRLQERFPRVEGWFCGKFAICQAAPIEEASSLNEALSHWEFRPIRFRPYRTPNGVKVAAIWHKSPVESRISHGSQYEVRREEEELRASGFFPCDVGSYLTGDGEERFVVAWVKTKPRGATEVLLLLSHKTGEKMEPDTAAALPVAVQHFWNQKKEPVDCQIRTKPGAPHLHVWGSRGNLQKTFNETKLVCIDISLTSLANEADVNKLHWAGTFHPREGIKFVEVYKPTFEENRAEWNRLFDDGFQPIAIGAVQLSGDATVCSTIWHGPVE